MVMGENRKENKLDFLTVFIIAMCVNFIILRSLIALIFGA